MCLDVLYYIHGGRKSGHWGLKERTRFGLTIALINAKIIIASSEAVGVASHSHIPQTNILLKQWRGEGGGNRENGLGKKDTQGIPCSLASSLHKSTFVIWCLSAAIKNSITRPCTAK